MTNFFTLQNGFENPAFSVVLYTILYSLGLSLLIALTYFKTTYRRDVSNNFINAIVLSSLVSATVVQAIGDSVAVGLGVLGALTVIRFRTNFRNPRNIIFMFAALAAGIASGVHGYTIAVVGTIGFCLVSLGLYFSGFGVSNNGEVMLRLVFVVPVTPCQLSKILKEYCTSSTLMEFREFPCERQQVSRSFTSANNKKFHYLYGIRLKDDSQDFELIARLKSMAPWESVKMEIIDNRESVWS